MSRRISSFCTVLLLCRDLEAVQKGCDAITTHFSGLVIHYDGETLSKKVVHGSEGGYVVRQRIAMYLIFQKKKRQNVYEICIYKKVFS